jgi:hypothetical protein
MPEFDIKRFYAWLKWLRDNPHNQIRGSYTGEGNDCCAMGALYRHTKPSEEFRDFTYFAGGDAICDILGLPIGIVIRWSDQDMLSFSEIADKLEAIAKEKGLI